MTKQKNILIVDDNNINRKILMKILSSEYNVLQAENGQVALEILKLYNTSIIGIILDLIMPVMDGYEFLKVILNIEQYKNIPIIITTGNNDKEYEKKALQLGAWDYITKPYDADIIKFRLKNAVTRSQFSAFEQLQYLATHDVLTGIYNKQKFFEVTRQMLDDNPNDDFVFIRFDIDRFSLINSFYGVDEGDKVLKYIAKRLVEKSKIHKKMTFARIEADTFAFCIPFKGVEAIYDLIENSKSEFREYNINFDIVPSYGVYEIVDRKLPINKMLDYANLAAKHIKGSYLNSYAFYNSDMSKAIEKEQEIINEMSEALASRQFVVYLQPKYSLQTRTPVGAEALVRWLHPTKGLISPGVFIPIFERNGFISKLDYYMWESVCVLIRKWLDNNIVPYPISVNVSRVNLYNPKLVTMLCELTDRYNIPRKFLNLELTESAYSDNPEPIQKAMTELHKQGFIILMDDFGSGYSSLNVLKDIEVDVLKIDMKFFSDTENSGRSENIIASVVRMAKWLNIQTIAEGVEKLEQVEFLDGIGCEYVQGYYFARPMPVTEYENLVASGEVFIEKNEKKFDTNSLWATNPQMEMLFTNISQSVAIYEFCEDKIDILRVNKAYYELFGYNDMAVGTQNPLKVVKNEYQQTLLKAFYTAAETENVAECEYIRKCSNGVEKWIRIVLKYANSIGNKKIIIGSLYDITAQREIDMQLQQYKLAIAKADTYTNKILIVDDVEVNRVILKEIFKDKYITLEAENGKRAIEILKQHNNEVDIILLDLKMPIMDGLEFLNYKKNTPDICNIPIVIITCDDNPQQQVNTISLGADDYIVKPFVPEIVVRRINNILESHKHFREVLKQYNHIVEFSQTDSLTNLYTRSSGDALIQEILKSNNKRTFAFIIADIDNLKDINDFYGDNIGNEIVVTVANQLKNTFNSKNDIISKLEGDEFSIFIPSITNQQEILNKCKQLCDEIGKMKIGTPKVSTSISMGVFVAQNMSMEGAKIYKSANMALYESKRNGKNRVTLFEHNKIVTAKGGQIQRECIVDALDEKLYIIDTENYNMLFMSNPAKKLYSVSDYKNKKCYEILCGRKEPCPNCINSKLSYDGFYERVWHNKYLDKYLLVKDKLINWDNRKAHIQVTNDITEAIPALTGKKEGIRSLT